MSCFIICAIPLVIICLVKSHFEAMADMLKLRFEAINEELEKLTKTNSFQNNQTSNNSRKLIKTSALLYRMRTFHGKLCMISCHINSYFGIQILFIIGYYFISFTAHAYFCLESYLTTYIEDRTVSFQLATTTIWAVLKLGILFALTLNCNTTKNEVSVLFWWNKEFCNVVLTKYSFSVSRIVSNSFIFILNILNCHKMLPSFNFIVLKWS